MQVRTARNAAPERLAVKSVKSLCRALAIVPESLLAELPCHAMPCPVHRPAHHHLAHSSKSSRKSPSCSPARANRQSSMRRDLHAKLAFPPGPRELSRCFLEMQLAAFGSPRTHGVTVSIA